jgi:shikimate 5-dehydrogenase
MKVFPRWMKVLGRPEVIIEGIDHKIHDEPAAYRATVAQIKGDPLSLGALVTTHKMDVYAAAHDMFDYFDPYALRTHEISSISKLESRMEGHAKDPITAGLSLDSIIGGGYFGRIGRQVLCLGAGGAGVATLLHLVNQEASGNRPARFIAVDRSADRLDHMRQMVSQFKTDMAVDYVLNSDPRRNDELMADLPDGSIVINATGMGKDTPGSPITDAGLFPKNGVAWEFNYRGDLDFLQQALRQQEARNLRVEGGWVYFLHGWSQVIAQVLHIELTPELFAKLDTVATATRGQ